MLRRGLGAALFALATASAAAAHVTLAPPFVELGVPSTIAFETPSERAGQATVAVDLTAPPGVELGETEPPTGWRLELAGRRARWSGGRIENEDAVSFPLVVTATGPLGTETFSTRQRYDDGEVVSWRANLSVLPASAVEPPSQRLDRALLAGVVGLLVIVGSFLVLRRARS